MKNTFKDPMKPRHKNIKRDNNGNIIKGLISLAVVGAVLNSIKK
jgi:hypothetical protein